MPEIRTKWEQSLYFKHIVDNCTLDNR